MPRKAKEHAGLEERPRRKRLIFSGTVDFRADTVTLPDGRQAMREFVDHPGAVAVLPVLPDGRLIFVRQFRYPVGEVTLEVPAGKLHSASDNPLKRAKAELKEETGYTAAKIRPVLSFWPTPAFSSEVLHVFTAEGLRPGASSPDEDEFVSVEALSFKQAWGLLRKGVIKDSKTIIALQARKIQLLENR